MAIHHPSFVLHSRKKFGSRPPMALCGAVFHSLQPLITSSVRMALEGRSKARGEMPGWLKNASDVRIIGFSEWNGDTIVRIEAQKLGDAAKEVYRQGCLRDELPAPDETALHLVARALSDIRSGNTQSSRYDTALLHEAHGLARLFAHDLESICLPESSEDDEFRAVIDEGVPRQAAELSQRTPAPRAVRVQGRLDRIRSSTRAFALKLDDGSEVHGVLDRPEMVPELVHLLNRRIAVVGTAVYRPSGCVLRVDAGHIEPAATVSPALSRVPPPLGYQAPLPVSREPKRRKGGVAAFFGTWPGEETEEDLLRAVREVRG